MRIKIVAKNISELIYVVYPSGGILTREKTIKLVRINKGHPLYKSTITKSVFWLESVKLYRKF